MADKFEPSPREDPFVLIILAILIVGIFGGFLSWLNSKQDLWVPFVKNIPFYLINFFAKYVVFSIFLSIVLLILVIVYARKESEIRKKLMDRVLPPSGEKKIDVTDSSIMENPKWKLVEEHINSDDANKWKLAILEADIILSEILDKLNLSGEGVGEKLKNVETSDFDHIEEAWEAHKIRNAIAHQGSDFLITQREAKRVIKLYKSIFEEFKII